MIQFPPMPLGLALALLPLSILIGAAGWALVVIGVLAYLALGL